MRDDGSRPAWSRILAVGFTALSLVSVATASDFFTHSKERRGVLPTRRASVNILPPGVLKSLENRHPLEEKIAAFLQRQADWSGFAPTGLNDRDYLRIIDGQVAVFRQLQDATGAIIDPVEKIEWQYSTPCYALSVALLVASGYNREPALLDSGVRAMALSVDEMHEYRTAHNHGEFFIQPVMLALDLYDPLVPAQQSAGWKRKLAQLDPYRLYPDNLPRKRRRGSTIYNHNVVALAGEYLLIKRGLNGDEDFLETHLAHQAEYMSLLGMYQDPNVPIVYDEFSRQYLTSILCEGYEGEFAGFYRDRLWRGAWTSLFTLSPFGECPTGGRSAQHIWNEAQCAVTYEMYANQYARNGRMAEAGAFKRAARLSLACIERWLRPDGSGYIVKNRYPIDAHHGYEHYSAQSQYNLLACWLMAVAYLYANENVAERPCPADIGGFVVPMLNDFHKIFANAGGTYIEYETSGDLYYNPTGLIRCHVKGSNPQLGPSDGAVHEFVRDPKTRQKQDVGGENLCIGPAWQDSSGAWHRLADYSPADPPKVEVFEETPERVRFSITYEGDFDGATRIVETLTLDPAGVTVEDQLEGPQLNRMRVYYPMLVFDGLEETQVKMASNSVRLSLWDGAIRFAVLEPQGTVLKRAGTRLVHRNGMVEAAYADIQGLRALYRIERN